MTNNDLIKELLSSIQFNIPTKAILNLQKEVFHWLDNGVLGAIIYGRPRIGKTRSIQYITKSLKDKYGKELPVYILNAYEHIPNMNQFYTDMLKAINHPMSNKGTALVKKERLINALLTAALETRYKRIILFIDEAFNFREKDYSWLMYIYNELNLKDVKLTVFMVGSKELKASKEALIHAKQHQIVGRFMTNEIEFHGISNIVDMQICLKSYDSSLDKYSFNDIIITEFYFPDAYADGHRLVKCSDIIMEEFAKLMSENDININSDIPMQYFINMIHNCLRTYGKYGKGIYFPTSEEWRISIIESGYIAAERCELGLTISL